MNTDQQTIAKSRHLYQLGRKIFSVSHEDAEFEYVLDQLLVRWQPKHLNQTADCIHDVHLGWRIELDELFEQLINLHDQFIWVRAASLIGPNGIKLLISGSAQSGKTALALSLYLKHAWKLLSEHTTLIDPDSNEIVPFATPFRLYQDTPNVMTELGISIPPRALYQLLPIPPNCIANTCLPPFDLAVHLSGEFSNQMEQRKISQSEYLMKLLSISNAAKSGHTGMENILKSLPPSNCYELQGGTTKERLACLLELSSTLTERPRSDLLPAPESAADQIAEVQENTDKHRQVIRLNLESNLEAVVAGPTSAWLENTVIPKSKAIQAKHPITDDLLISVMGLANRRPLVPPENYGPVVGGLLALTAGAEPTVRVLDRLPCTGMWIDQQAFIRAIYHQGMTLHVHTPAGVRILSNDRYSCIHDVRYQFGQLYVVSTATNEVVQLDLVDSQALRVWKFPGDGDACHLNGLDLWEGRYVVSCFGRFENATPWRENATGTGQVLDLETGESLWDGLTFPHTPRMHLGQQLVCDSGTNRLLIRDPDHAEIRSIHFPGAFPRGIAFGDDRIYVGLSRNRSKTDTDNSIPNARIAIIRRSNLELLDQIDLPCWEIYDVVTLPKDCHNIISSSGTWEY
jgi:hypothetical protein